MRKSASSSDTRLLVLADDHKPVNCTPQIREEARAHLNKLRKSYGTPAEVWERGIR